MVHVDGTSGTVDINLSGLVDASRLRLSGSALTFATPPPGVITIDPAVVSHTEGGAGASTGYAFTVTRSGNTTGATTVSWTVAGTGASPADAADFGGALPGGTLTFADGQSTGTIAFTVAGDDAAEGDEGFAVPESQPRNAPLGTSVTVIGNDDVVSPPPPPPHSPPTLEPQTLPQPANRTPTV